MHLGSSVSPAIVLESETTPSSVTVLLLPTRQQCQLYVRLGDGARAHLSYRSYWSQYEYQVSVKYNHAPMISTNTLQDVLSDRVVHDRDKELTLLGGHVSSQGKVRWDFPFSPTSTQQKA